MLTIVYVTSSLHQFSEQP